MSHVPETVLGDRLNGLDPGALMQLGLEVPPEPPRGGSDSGESRFVPPDPAELAAHFPDLEILECIGRGGMGCVYKARQKHLDRLVALKILPSELSSDPTFAERFTREARTLARLTHPNIVTIHNFGQAGGLSYLVMEYVDGMNLRESLQAERPKLAEALRIATRLCEALQYAHSEGVVHRDLKPENILFDRHGHMKLADFGLVKLARGSEFDPTLTQSRQAMGTVYYMAPEQFRNSHAVDHRADLYALGVILYEMLTGQLPLGRFDPPSQLVGVPSELDEVVLRAMQSNPDNRYRDAGEMSQDIARCGRAAQNPLRYVPELPRQLRHALPQILDRLSGPPVAVANALRALAGFLLQQVLLFPYPTAVACGLIITLGCLPWVVVAGRGWGEVGFETSMVVHGVRVENFWPAVAAGAILFLTLFRRWLGIRAELLSMALCAYGIGHVWLFYASGPQYLPWSGEFSGAADATATPLVVAVTFAVLMIGNFLSLLRRVYVSIEGERNVRSFCRSMYRNLMSEMRDL